jgi:hypothetical protein
MLGDQAATYFRHHGKALSAVTLHYHYMQKCQDDKNITHI